jgi:acyl-CoA thioester hydrolase
MTHPDLTGFPVVVELDVAWGDMDSFGHVNNVVFFRYFEAARIEYLARVGWFELMQATGIGPIVHSTQCRFRKPLAYPDRVAVGARAVAREPDRITLEHRLVSRRWDGPAADGQVVVVCFDYRAGKKAPLPEDLWERIDRLEQVPNGPAPT